MKPITEVTHIGKGMTLVDENNNEATITDMMQLDNTVYIKLNNQPVWSPWDWDRINKNIAVKENNQ